MCVSRGLHVWEVRGKATPGLQMYLFHLLSASLPIQEEDDHFCVFSVMVSANMYPDIIMCQALHMHYLMYPLCYPMRLIFIHMVS